ncbi:hypothetical protein ANO14919_136160 [Xylariales sp. No.14919]|nr:hypothetical protein ANO14919_136160 [Xylariales sp. No.14919]
MLTFAEMLDNGGGQITGWDVPKAGKGKGQSVQ